MKKIIITGIICFLQFFLVTGILVYVNRYQSEAYEADLATYEQQKAERYEIIRDSLFSVWLSSNDTTIRKIKKIKRKPIYEARGYYKTTEKLRCAKEHNSEEYICEPIKKWVTTDYYISGYGNDTTWTEGYVNRDDFLNIASNFADTKAKVQIEQFKEYDGHESNFLINEDTMLILQFISGILFIVGFIILLMYDIKI